MKDYQVEALTYFSELSMNAKRNSEHIANTSKADIQMKLAEYASKGYRLTSATTTIFGPALHVYLFFEKDV